LTSATGKIIRSKTATFLHVRLEAFLEHCACRILAGSFRVVDLFPQVAVGGREPAICEEHAITGGMNIGSARVGQKRRQVLAR
jgi:hypothetical protein